MKRAWILLALAACARPPAPVYRGEGAELVGRAWAGDGLRWIDERPARGRVTLVRWWTNG